MYFLGKLILVYFIKGYRITYIIQQWHLLPSIPNSFYLFLTDYPFVYGKPLNGYFDKQ